LKTGAKIEDPALNERAAEFGGAYRRTG